MLVSDANYKKPSPPSGCFVVDFLLMLIFTTNQSVWFGQSWKGGFLNNTGTNRNTLSCPEFFMEHHTQAQLKATSVAYDGERLNPSLQLGIPCLKQKGNAEGTKDLWTPIASLLIVVRFRQRQGQSDHQNPRVLDLVPYSAPASSLPQCRLNTLTQDSPTFESQELRYQENSKRSTLRVAQIPKRQVQNSLDWGLLPCPMSLPMSISVK